jgi:hypothetical protein
MKRVNVPTIAGNMMIMNPKTFISLSVLLVACGSSGASRTQDSQQDAPASTPDGVDSGPTPDTTTGDVDASVETLDATVVDAALADVGVVDASPDAHVPTQLDCLAACEAAHPLAAALSKNIDACFTGACSASCDGLAYSGKLYNPTSADAGFACTGTNSDPIAVVSAGCADCVAANCCAQWVAVFSTQDGRDLNKCAVECYSIK